MSNRFTPLVLIFLLSTAFAGANSFVYAQTAEKYWGSINTEAYVFEAINDVVGTNITTPLVTLFHDLPVQLRDSEEVVIDEDRVAEVIQIPARAISSIICSASPPSLSIGESVSVAGAIYPVHGGVVVTLTYTKPDGMEVIRTVITAGDGSYSDTYNPDQVGPWSLKADWEGDEDHEGAESQPVQNKQTL